MILAIDIGNTNIVVGCIRGDEVLFTERLSTNTTHTTLEYAISFKNVLEIYQIDAKEIESSPYQKQNGNDPEKGRCKTPPKGKQQFDTGPHAFQHGCACNTFCLPFFPHHRFYQDKQSHIR